jgi:uncharacterized alpha-E superfamily protein
MISRVAECCFWLARYLERVDSLARLLAVHHGLHIDAVASSQYRWRPLLRVTGQEQAYVERLGEDSLDDGEAIERYVTWDEENASSLLHAVAAARENARTVREVMSLEPWEAINDLWLWMNDEASRRLYDQNRSAFYEHLFRSTVLFHGLTHATMLHDEPFSFVKLGRAVERAGQTARILDAHSGRAPGTEGDAADAARWLATLRSCCAYDPFFRRSKHFLDQRSVTEFLLFDRDFPRSVLFSLDEARSLLFELRRDDPRGLPRRSTESLERIRGELLQMDMTDVRRRGFHRTLGWIIDATDKLCDAIHDDYLDPPEAWIRHCVRVLEKLGSATPADRAA